MTRDPLLRLEAVSKVFRGGTVGLDDVDLDIGHGEFVTLLGPSGCGKTTSLRVMAGFEAPTSGRVLLEGQDITHLRPYDRPLNTVFQDYALFPHMDVAENVGFGLSLRKLAAGDISRKVAAALDLVGLTEKLHTRVSMLSGGQRQRVALARALVCEPRVLLLDEPLSALDANLREQMQFELKRLQARLGTTFVMVTHDQTEALSISDRIVVLHRGRIEQIASPSELYDAPATRFVADFIGTMNFLDGEILDASAGALRVAAGGMTIEMAQDRDVSLPERGAAVIVCLRPEEIAICSPGSDGAAEAKVISTAFHGPTVRLVAETAGGGVLTIDAPRRNAEVTLTPGASIHVRAVRGLGRLIGRT